MMHTLEVFLLIINVVLWPLNIILWCSNRRRRRFVDTAKHAVIWEAAERLGEWQHQGLVAFTNRNPFERAYHLWKLCDDKDIGMVQYRLGLLAGPNGYAVYNMMLARRKFWQVL